MAMFRITSSKVVSTAVRAISSGRILCGSITNAFNGCDQVYTIPLAISHHFSTDVKKQIDRKLMKFLKCEINLKQKLLDTEMPALPSDFPFTVQENNNDIILTRDFDGEKITVVVMPSDMAEEDESDSDTSATDVDDISSGDNDDDDINHSGEEEKEEEPLSLLETVSKENEKFSEFDTTINNNPKRTRFRKQRRGRGRMKGISYQGNHICFGKYALQVLEPAQITSRQIEAGRLALTLNASRGRKIWVRIFPDKPVTIKPNETRMGSGKGSPEYCVAIVKPGRILYEMSGVTEHIARRTILIAASKMPIRTRFIISR
ncbi:hypothetical protein ACS0TY_015685 [Phlomoides rotata]